MDVLDLLAREGLIDASSIPQLREGLDPSVAKVVDAGLVAEDVLADIVAREAGTVVIDLDRGTLEPEAVYLLPPEIAKQHLALVVALEPNGRSVRAAFANPLDEIALAAVAEATGRVVTAMAATVSSLRRALEREYEERSSKRLLTPTVRVPSESDLPPESTRRVAARRDADGPPSEEGPLTLAVHRFEQEATIEQKHEALLLTLIEKGVLTRAEYGDALKRLLGRR